MSANKLYGDDTPFPVPALGNGKTRTGRLWPYFHDDRPAGGTKPPAGVVFLHARSQGEHPKARLSSFTGTQQVERLRGVRLGVRSGAHPGRAGRTSKKVLRSAHRPQILGRGGAMERIAELYAIEQEIRGRPPEERREVRNTRA